MNENNLKLALTELMYKDADELMIENIPYEFSAEFEKRMSKLIKRRRKPYFRMINTVGKRAACIALAVFIASATTVMSVDAFREAVFRFFMNIFSTHSDITAIDDDQHPNTIEDIYEITYDLSEYTIDYEDYTEYSRNISYINGEISIDFQQYTKEMYDENINTEGADISTININDNEALYFHDNHQYDCLIWDNGDYILVIYSNIGKDELISIAKSVQKVE